MTTKEQDFIFNHVKSTLLPIQEGKMRQALKNEIRKMEIQNSKRVLEIIKLEPVLDLKIKELHNLLDDVTQKLSNLAEINSRLSNVEDKQEELDIDKIVDLLLTKLA